MQEINNRKQPGKPPQTHTVKGLELFFVFFNYWLISYTTLWYIGTVFLIGIILEGLQQWKIKSFCVPAKYLEKHKNN